MVTALPAQMSTQKKSVRDDFQPSGGLDDDNFVMTGSVIEI